MAKSSGLVDVVARWLQSLSMDLEFDCRDAVLFMGDVMDRPPSMKAMARALAVLAERDEVRLTRKAHRPGDNLAVNFYARGDGTRQVQKPKRAPEQVEHAGKVRITELSPGHRQVRHGMAWKPFREPRSSDKWMGYQSSLADIG